MSRLDNVDELEHAVLQTIGTASTCWDDLYGAGQFDEALANELGDELLDWIKARYVPIEEVNVD